MPSLEDIQKLAADTASRERVEERMAQGSVHEDHSGTDLAAHQPEELSTAFSTLTPQPAPDLSHADSLTPPQRAALARFISQAPSIITQAQSVKVISPETKQLAAQHRQDIRAALDLLEAFKRPEINRAHQAHKNALAELATLTAPWREADSILKSSQDQYELQLRREREAAARKLEEEMRQARERALEEQLTQAQKAQDSAAIVEVIERAAAPPPTIPVVHIPVPAEGSSTRGTHTYTLLNVNKIRPEFVMDAIRAEMGRKGKCEWLNRAIQKCVNERGKGAVEVVGVGSIEYSEGVSTGVRRRK